MDSRRSSKSLNERRSHRTRISSNPAPYITRKIGTFDILDEESLSLIERSADRILSEVGIEVRNDPVSLKI